MYWKKLNVGIGPLDFLPYETSKAVLWLKASQLQNTVEPAKKPCHIMHKRTDMTEYKIPVPSTKVSLA